MITGRKVSDKDLLEILKSELVVVVNIVSGHKIKSVLLGYWVISIEGGIEVPDHGACLGSIDKSGSIGIVLLEYLSGQDPSTGGIESPIYNHVTGSGGSGCFNGILRLEGVKVHGVCSGGGGYGIRCEQACGALL